MLKHLTTFDMCIPSDRAFQYSRGSMEWHTATCIKIIAIILTVYPSPSH